MISKVEVNIHALTPFHQKFSDLSLKRIADWVSSVGQTRIDGFVDKLPNVGLIIGDAYSNVDLVLFLQSKLDVVISPT